MFTYIHIEPKISVEIVQQSFKADEACVGRFRLLANDTNEVSSAVNNDLKQINFVPLLALFIRAEVDLLSKARFQFTGGQDHPARLHCVHMF